MSERLDPVRLHAIVDRARRILRAQACSILVHEPGSRSLVFAAMSGEGSEPIGGTESLVGVKIPDSAGVAGWVLATREPLFLEDVANDHRFAEDIAETIGYVPRRLMAVPLLLGDRALGVLEVLDCPEQAKFSNTGQLGDFADEAVLALTDPGLAGEAMSQENVQAVAACIAAYNAADWNRAVAILAPDVEWRDSSDHPDRRTVVGPDAAIEHLRARLAVVASIFDVDRLVDHGDKVVAIGHLVANAISSEGEIRTPFALLFTFGAGFVIRIEEFRNHTEALEAAGLEE